MTLDGTPQDPYRLYTREEAADFLRVNVATVSAITTAGELHAIRLGRRLLIPRVALERFVRGEPGPIDDGQWPPTPSMFNTESASRARHPAGKQRPTETELS